MKVVVTGATGNLGTSVLGALSEDERVTSIVGVARRVPSLALPKVQWEAADVSVSRLDPILEGADAVVHLAWIVQPSHSPHVLDNVNVGGSKRVFDAAIRSGVTKLVVASSVGAYSPADSKSPVDESYPVDGVVTSAYSQQKVRVERLLDRIEYANPELKVARMRPSLIFKGDAASEIRSYFIGSFLPVGPILKAKLVRLLPLPSGMTLQAVHSSDAGRAFAMAATDQSASGAYNIAGAPVLDRNDIAAAFGAKPVPIPASALRAIVDLSWKTRLQPTELGWLDMGLCAPVLDTTRAQKELGWVPTVSAVDAFEELVRGLADSRSWATSPLAPGRVRATAR